MKYFVNVLVDVLGAVYQAAGASLLIAVLIMCVYMLGRKQGVGPVARAWIWQFKENSWFRRHFFLVFYTCMLLFRTLFCRSVWGNPLENVIGIWGLHYNGQLYTENFENLILFMPFIIFLFWAREEKDHTKDKRIQEVLLNSFEISFCFSLGILYLNYFIHGVGCSILGQAVIKEALATAWGVEAMAITAISAALGLGRLIALPFAGPLSDKLGRRISTAIGSASYAIYLIGLALAFNAGTSGGYTIAYVCAVLGGIANSFLDTGIYPAVSEIIYKAPGVATMGIKFFIAIAQMLLPFVLGATVATTAAGLTSYNRLFYGCGIIYLVLFVLVFLFPLPDADQMAAGKKEGLIDSLKHTHFSFESIAMILIGFTCTGTFQLWLNCAQNFAKENVGWADPSIMQTYYSAGTLIALVVTALLTRKIKDVRFIVIYPVICLATLIVVLTGQNQTLMIAVAFIIGWAGAGGLLQIATSVCNMLFPKIKGTVTALVMIASSLCNYTILTAASKMQPSQVMIMNIVLTAVGVVLGLFVNIRYKKMVELAEAEN